MIWIVTEQKNVADELTRLIEAQGYSTATMDCGDDVPKKLHFQRPATVVIDCGLKDSFDLVTAVRRDPYSKPVPLLMFAVTGQDLREQALARGADGFVAKGALDWAELIDEIVRLAGPPPKRANG